MSEHKVKARKASIPAGCLTKDSKTGEAQPCLVNENGVFILRNTRVQLHDIVSALEDDREARLKSFNRPKQ